jgi:protein gp37
MAETDIEWTDVVWNPTRGCSHVSPGCAHCFAERVGARGATPGGAYHGLIRIGTGGAPRWTGKVRLVPEKLDEPLRWRKPRRVFVNSMSDLFHEKLDDKDIARVFAVMALAKHHTFQVLTKRARRMRHWFIGQHRPNVDVYDAATPMLPRVNGQPDWPLMPSDMASTRSSGGAWWPLSNVHVGVSVENQAAADERIPLLLETPAAVRFLSVEPLLGPVDLRPWLALDRAGAYTKSGHQHPVDWVIVGGESGPGARPCDVAWIRSVVEQCKAAGVPCFVKQLGAVVHDRNDVGFMGDDGDAWPDVAGGIESLGRADDYQGGTCRVLLRDRKGGDMAEWPADLRVRQFPEACR